MELGPAVRMRASKVGGSPYKVVGFPFPLSYINALFLLVCFAWKIGQPGGTRVALP